MTCQHRFRTRATNITAVIERGYLVSAPPGRELQYDVVEFCSNPSCEKVHSAVRTK